MLFVKPMDFGAPRRAVLPVIIRWIFHIYVVFIFACALCCLTEKAEPPPTNDVSRDSGTDNAIGGWLQRLVRPRNREIHNKIRQIQTLANPAAPHLLAASNRRELNLNELPKSCSSKSNCPNHRQPNQQSKIQKRSWPNVES
jgi:hypothetical protein